MRSDLKEFNTIKAGYRLIVSSWENDLDNYNTIYLDGLSKERCAYLVDLCKMLDHDSSGNWQERIDNLYSPSEKERSRLYAEFSTVMEKHGIEGDPDDQLDDLYELGLSGGEYLTRVCEGYVAQYFAYPMTFTDATPEFD